MKNDAKTEKYFDGKKLENGLIKLKKEEKPMKNEKNNNLNEQNVKKEKKRRKLGKKTQETRKTPKRNSILKKTKNIPEKKNSEKKNLRKKFFLNQNLKTKKIKKSDLQIRLEAETSGREEDVADWLKLDHVLKTGSEGKVLSVFVVSGW